MNSSSTAFFSLSNWVIWVLTRLFLISKICELDENFKQTFLFILLEIKNEKENRLTDEKGLFHFLGNSNFPELNFFFEI